MFCAKMRKVQDVWNGLKRLAIRNLTRLARTRSVSVRSEQDSSKTVRLPRKL